MAKEQAGSKISMKGQARKAYGNARAKVSVAKAGVKRKTSAQLAAAKENLKKAWAAVKRGVRGALGAARRAVGKGALSVAKRTGSKTAGRVYAKAAGNRVSGPAGGSARKVTRRYSSAR